MAPKEAIRLPHGFNELGDSVESAVKSGGEMGKRVPCNDSRFSLGESAVSQREIVAARG